jgi:predicted enzyme related to lactoylglutathione lyase
MRAEHRDRVVHLELRAQNPACACAFYGELFGWHAENVHIGPMSYLALDLGGKIDGGVIEHDAERPLWLPYVAVADIAEVTERARSLGARIVLEPREGPAGWRSILAPPSGAEIALWQRKS